VMEPAPEAGGGLKIETRGGHRVEVSGREQIALAVELIRALERSGC